VVAAAGGELRGFVQRETMRPTSRVEFLARDASKWSGVQWVAARRAIAPAQIVAVGDEANDVEMLAAAGRSLAAPGASDVARAAASIAIEGDGPAAVVAALARLFVVDLPPGSGT
jgi:hydroxymethylpyrimidine pyrophosphatase-like HAD family hydrolase